MYRALCTIALVAVLLGFAAPARSEQPRAFDIPQIKAALRITPAQEQFWAPVEAVLNDIARNHEAQQAQATANSRRRVVIVLDSAAVNRLAQAARPLVAVLSEQQKQSARELAQKMGLMHVLAALR